MDNKNKINQSPRKYLFQSLTYSLVQCLEMHWYERACTVGCASVYFKNQIEEHDCLFIALLLSTNDETICGKRINLKNIIYVKSIALTSPSSVCMYKYSKQAEHFFSPLVPFVAHTNAVYTRCLTDCRAWNKLIDPKKWWLLHRLYLYLCDIILIALSTSSNVRKMLIPVFITDGAIIVFVCRASQLQLIRCNAINSRLNNCAREVFARTAHETKAQLKHTHTHADSQTE